MSSEYDEGTWFRYDLRTAGGEPVVMECSTNDDDDDGVPDGKIERWTERYTSLDVALAHAGHTRTGWGGTRVTVTVDGREV